MQKNISQLLMPALFVLLTCTAFSQPLEKRPFLEPADSLNKARFWISAATGTAIYAGFSFALYQTWYKENELTGFHTFNDWGEWNHVDKMGHLFTAHMESNYSFQGLLWTGMERRTAMWMAAGIGLSLQATVEVMDGFSSKWGFSWGDMGFDLMGIGLFISQEMAWKEQRIIMKVSNSIPDYPESPLFSSKGNQTSSLAQRGADLYGSGFSEIFLKDYNGLTVWASLNIYAFMKNKGPSRRFPKWLNLAFGYGSENLFGGFSNTWRNDDGAVFALNGADYPRYRQFYLSPDLDLSRINTKSRLLNTLLGIVNWIKIPAPALEVNSLGKVKFHALYW